jgi:putative acetyltransferase
MSELDVEIRPEQPSDRERVFEINAAAFGSEVEPNLVEQMRGQVSPEISLVAALGRELGGELVGHIYFSPVHVGESRRPAIGLGPVAVDPACQRKNVGSQLCRRGLELCLELDEPVVFVLGHPDYYPRFGFRPALPHGLYYRNEHYAPAFFVAELREGALAGFEGEVVYHEAYDGT